MMINLHGAFSRCDLSCDGYTRPDGTPDYRASADCHGRAADCYGAKKHLALLSFIPLGIGVACIPFHWYVAMMGLYVLTLGMCVGALVTDTWGKEVRDAKA